MSAFFAGWCAMAAIVAGVEWLKYREGILAFAFWTNSIIAVLSAVLWIFF